MNYPWTENNPFCVFSNSAPSRSPSKRRETPNNVLPPRDNRQFLLGPPFERTKQLLRVWSCHQIFEPMICARIDRGIQKVSDVWVCYKRNYVTMVAAMHWKNQPIQSFECWIETPGGKRKARELFLQVKALLCSDGSLHPLHLSPVKRDGEAKIPVPTVTVVPGMVPIHDFVVSTANLRQAERLDDIRHVFETENGVARVAKWERLQFGGRHSSGRFNEYQLRVELVAVVDRETRLVVAYTESPRIVLQTQAQGKFIKEYYIPGPLLPREEDLIAEHENPKLENRVTLAEISPPRKRKRSPMNSPIKKHQKIGQIPRLSSGPLLLKSGTQLPMSQLILPQISRDSRCQDWETGRCENSNYAFDASLMSTPIKCSNEIDHWWFDEQSSPMKELAFSQSIPQFSGPEAHSQLSESGHFFSSRPHTRAIEDYFNPNLDLFWD